MALSALKFIGLAIGAVVLGVLSTSFAFSQMGAGESRFTGHGSNAWIALKYDSKVTEDEIAGRIRHIMRRH
jgi:hypothetical protein